MKRKMDHFAIFEVACFLKPTYDIQQKRYMEFVNDPSEEKSLLWEGAVEAYHRVLMGSAINLGRATTAGTGGIKMLMGVRDNLIIWTPAWILNIANYERLNPNYWVHPQAVKLNSYVFPREISS